MAEWVEVARLADLQEGRGHEVWVQQRPLALFLHQGQVYALDDRCPHREGQLSQGAVVGSDAVCPLHGWNFDLATGVSPYNPHDRIATYPARIRDGRVEVDAQAVPPLPASVFDGYQGRWRRWAGDARGKAEIRRLAAGRRPPVEAMGSEATAIAPFPGFDHFHLRAGQLAAMPLLENEVVDTTVSLGRGCERPLTLRLPAFVSHMSFGALSAEAKVALAAGAKAAGTAIGSGEGGMLPAERDAAGLYILEVASGYFGWNEAAQARADAFEFKIGQSAKPGLGGELPGDKVSAEIAAVRGITAGQPAHSPARFPDVGELAELGARVAALREAYPERPIGVKLVANDVERDVVAALSVQPDWITLDGFGGGTGAAPAHVRDHFGMPLVQALPVARRLIDQYNERHPERPVSLVATGGIRTPTDVLKALALGADACALATAALFALGCEYYRACNTDNCPTGVATQRAELRGRIDVGMGAERVGRFLNGTRAVLEDYLRVMGRRALRELGPGDLIALSSEARDILGRA